MNVRVLSTNDERNPCTATRFSDELGPERRCHIPGMAREISSNCDPVDTRIRTNVEKRGTLRCDELFRTELARVALNRSPRQADRHEHTFASSAEHRRNRDGSW